MIVTGAAGFIGSHVASALLRRGCRAVGIDNFDPFYDRRIKSANISRIASRPGCFELIEADVCDAGRMRGIFDRVRPSAVVHLAALAGVRPSIADPARYAAVNVSGLVNVLDAARAVGCRRVVFASSSSVYGNNRKVPFAESDPVDEPISPYAATKRAGELVCHAYSHLFGLSIAALRFFTVYGPSQRPDLAISTFMRLIAAGQEVPMFGDGSSSRDYTYIDDIIVGVLAAFDLAAAKAVEGPIQSQPGSAAETRAGCGFFRIFNLGGSQPVSLAEMIDTIAQVVGKPARIKRLPMQPGDVERTFADIARSQSELRYQPDTTFTDGLIHQWQWMKSADDRLAALP